MTIIECLKKEGIVLSKYDKWMTWHKKTEMWLVYKRQYGKLAKIICHTSLEENAVEELIKED